ncbi:UNVERIFIED_ORG: hypothetical protein J2S79_003134 [Pantoea agglomerans]
MLSFFLQSIKMGYIKAFDCYGKDSKWQYLCIITFQLAWFLFYLWIPYRSDYAILLFLLFFLPVISSNTRCINYYGRSRALCFLWIIAPYVMLFVPLFLTKRRNTEDN